MILCLKGLNSLMKRHLVVNLPLFAREITSRLPICFPAHQSPSEKGSTLKRKYFVLLRIEGKNLLLLTGNSLLLELIPFSKHYENMPIQIY